MNGNSWTLKSFNFLKVLVNLPEFLLKFRSFNFCFFFISNFVIMACLNQKLKKISLSKKLIKLFIKKSTYFFILSL